MRCKALPARRRRRRVARTCQPNGPRRYIGHGAVALREIADSLQWRDDAIHRIERLEHDQLRPLGCLRRQQFFEVSTSLWRQIFLSTPARRTPSIIELWFQASDRITQFGSSLAMVGMPVSLDT
jgi:hypothetical protein